jgi:hypothetical protein
MPHLRAFTGGRDKLLAKWASSSQFDFTSPGVRPRWRLNGSFAPIMVGRRADRAFQYRTYRHKSKTRNLAVPRLRVTACSTIFRKKP